MERKLFYLGVFGIFPALFLLTACGYKAEVKPPPSIAISNSIGEMYLRAGLASELGKREVLGKHYQPGLDSWKLVACVEFTMPDGGNNKDCNDSFELYKLDSGNWMLNGTLNGTYLWVEMR